MGKGDNAKHFKGKYEAKLEFTVGWDKPKNLLQWESRGGRGLGDGHYLAEHNTKKLQYGMHY